MAAIVQRVRVPFPQLSPMMTPNVTVGGYQNQEVDVATVLLTRLLTLFSFMLLSTYQSAVLLLLGPLASTFPISGDLWGV